MADQTPAAEGPYTKANAFIAACALAGGAGLFMLLWRVLPWLGLVSTTAQRVAQETYLSQLYSEYHAGQINMRQLRAFEGTLAAEDMAYVDLLLLRLPEVARQIEALRRIRDDGRWGAWLRGGRWVSEKAWWVVELGQWRFGLRRALAQALVELGMLPVEEQLA